MRELETLVSSARASGLASPSRWCSLALLCLFCLLLWLPPCSRVDAASISSDADAELVNPLSYNLSSDFLLLPRSDASFSSTTAGRSRHVLVLGSGGLIGTALSAWLHEHSYTVLRVPSRALLDLRVNGSLELFSSIPIDFAFFLACEVGGSKFLDSSSSQVQASIIQYNLAIYHNVLPYLKARAIPYLFTSSYLQHLPTAYGSIKRLGEAWIQADGLGKIVRLWNVYGRERAGDKAHVMTDWVLGCLSRSHVHSMSDGTEWRQFTHANDTAAALGLMMTSFQQLDAITELAGSEWVEMRQLAYRIANRSVLHHSSVVPVSTSSLGPKSSSSSFSSSASIISASTLEQHGHCTVTLSNKPASIREHLLPSTSTWWHQNSGWRPLVTLNQGIDDLFVVNSRELSISSTSDVVLQQSVSLSANLPLLPSSSL